MQSSTYLIVFGLGLGCSYQFSIHILCNILSIEHTIFISLSIHA